MKHKDYETVGKKKKKIFSTTNVQQKYLAKVSLYECCLCTYNIYSAMSHQYINISILKKEELYINDNNDINRFHCSKDFQIVIQQ